MWPKILVWVIRHWKALALLTALTVVLGWAYRAGQKSQADEIAAAQAKAATCQANYSALQSQLAEADAAAKRAKAEAEKAARDAQRRVQAARKEWERTFNAKPENRRWADEPLPADVARGLRP